MIFLRIIIAISLFVMFGCATSDSTIVTSYAKALSKADVSVVKVEIERKDYSGSLNDKCISNIDESYFNERNQEIINRNFSKSEISYLEKFFSSSAGIKYTENGVQESRSNILNITFNKIPYTVDENKEINSFQSSNVAKKHLSIFTPTNKDWNELLAPVFEDIISKCKKQ
jgi:uncharacterized lipoprotein YajG